jgi:DNA helicase-2/ATP-dependent DNA helicase PcrA
MLPYRDAYAVYKAFYSDPARRHLFAPLGRKKIEYADVFALIYTMIRTDRHEGYRRIRHLLVDEMQDYTPIQYAVLRELFDCKMTILGDSNQSVNPFSSSSPAAIHAIFADADVLELRKSYRSTTEICEFAQRISRNDRIIAIERHGMPPEIIGCADRDDETARITQLIARHRRSEHRSLGVICKTAAEAHTLHGALAEHGVASSLLDHDTTEFAGGVVVTSAHLAKGLEFDTVIVPHVSDTNYTSELDRCMLYIACTRAMHELYLTHTGPISRLLTPADDHVHPRERLGTGPRHARD